MWLKTMDNNFNEEEDRLIIFLGSIYGKSRQGYDGSVYDIDGICPSILTNSVTHNKMMILVEDDTLNE